MSWSSVSPATARANSTRRSMSGGGEPLTLPVVVLFCEGPSCSGMTASSFESDWRRAAVPARRGPSAFSVELHGASGFRPAAAVASFGTAWAGRPFRRRRVRPPDGTLFLFLPGGDGVAFVTRARAPLGIGPSQHVAPAVHDAPAELAEYR